VQGKGSPVKIGQSYFFDAIGEKGQLGTVTFTNVLESEKKVYFTVVAEDGTNHILAGPISDEALADYKAHPEAFFGAIQHVGKKSMILTSCLSSLCVATRRRRQKSSWNLCKGRRTSRRCVGWNRRI
jgi:hypothetical protein